MRLKRLRRALVYEMDIGMDEICIYVSKFQTL